MEKTPFPATLDELEQVDLGTVAEGERAPFRITDDRCADWAIRKIADERTKDAQLNHELHVLEQTLKG